MGNILSTGFPVCFIHKLQGHLQVLFLKVILKVIVWTNWSPKSRHQRYSKFAVQNMEQIAICYCLFWAVCALWLAEASTATHTPGDTANHRLFTLYFICMCISARQNMMIVNQIWVLYTTPDRWVGQVNRSGTTLITFDVEVTGVIFDRNSVV